jgi:hypothetical protein
VGKQGNTGAGGTGRHEVKYEGTLLVLTSFWMEILLTEGKRRIIIVTFFSCMGR